jgi:hypothetical protein
MTVFKVYELDGHFFYSVDSSDLKKALRTLWNTFGDTIRYDIVLSKKGGHNVEHSSKRGSRRQLRIV